MLATQMEPVQARRLFPGWDEPVFRASFEIVAVIDAPLNAVSNMPKSKIELRPDGRKEVSFARSVPMSTYLVGLFVGEMDLLEDSVDGIRLGIHTVKGKRARARYAMEATKEVLHYFNDYFGEPYPLVKLDQIALPGGIGGAMENWGAIAYNEGRFLYDPGEDSLQQQQGVYGIIAHEIAHQWFGNLVTMAWWDNLWLNEGFASWMAGKASARFNPRWGAPLRDAQRRTPARIEARRGLARHPRGEALVQPQVVPPGHRHEVAEPLVRDLVRDDAVDPLLLLQRIFARVVEEAAFVVGDRAPVLHRAAYAPRKRDLIQLDQGVRLAEVVVEVVEDLLGRLHRVTRARALAFDGMDPEPDSIGAVFQEIHLPDEEPHQIRRHRHRSRKTHFLPAVGPELDLGLRHVRDRGQGRVDHRDDLECRAKHRLVPSRKEPARPHRLHLGGQHQLFHEPPFFALLLRYLVQALGMLSDLPRVLDAQPLAPGRDRRGPRGKRHPF